MTKVLAEVGIKADPAQLKALMEALKGKKLHELIAQGMSKIQVVATGGNIVAIYLLLAAPSAKADEKADKKKEKAKPETKKEVKKEEKKEEEVPDALAGGMGLFGDES